MSIVFYTTLVLFIFVSLVMTLLVLIQKGRGGGLASAFGGGGGNTAFGSKTGDVLTWATSVVFGVFIVLAVVLNLSANRMATQRSSLVAPPPAESTSGNMPADVTGATGSSGVPNGTVPMDPNPPAGNAPAAPAAPTTR